MERGRIYITQHEAGAAAPKCAAATGQTGGEKFTLFSTILIYSLLFYLLLFLSTELELQFPRADLFQYILCGPASSGRAGLRLDSGMQCRLSELKTD